MKPGADVKSIDAIRDFRSELKRYLESLQQTLEYLTIQSNRATEWIEQDRTRYWPRQAKAAEDRLVEARNALLRCKMASMEGQSKSCVDEERAVEKWVRRQRMCEQKSRDVKKWRERMRHETDDFVTRLSRLSTYAENDIPKAIASLSRMIQSLEKYTELTSPSSRPASSGSAVESEHENPPENGEESAKNTESS